MHRGRLSTLRGKPKRRNLKLQYRLSGECRSRALPTSQRRFRCCPRPETGAIITSTKHSVRLGLAEMRLPSSIPHHIGNCRTNSKRARWRLRYVTTSSVSFGPDGQEVRIGQRFLFFIDCRSQPLPECILYKGGFPDFVRIVDDRFAFRSRMATDVLLDGQLGKDRHAVH